MKTPRTAASALLALLFSTIAFALVTPGTQQQPARQATSSSEQAGQGEGPTERSQQLASLKINRSETIAEPEAAPDAEGESESSVATETVNEDEDEEEEWEAPAPVAWAGAAAIPLPWAPARPYYPAPTQPYYPVPPKPSVIWLPGAATYNDCSGSTPLGYGLYQDICYPGIYLLSPNYSVGGSFLGAKIGSTIMYQGRPYTVYSTYYSTSAAQVGPARAGGAALTLHTCATPAGGNPIFVVLASPS